MSKEIYAGIFLTLATVVAMLFFKSLGSNTKQGKAVSAVFAFISTATIGYVLYLATNNFYLMRIGLIGTYVSIIWTLSFLNVFVLFYTGKKIVYKRSVIIISILLLIDSILLVMHYMVNIRDAFIEYEVNGELYLKCVQSYALYIHFFLCIALLLGAVVNLYVYSFKVARVYRGKYLTIAIWLTALVVCDNISRMYKSSVDYAMLAYPILACFIYFYLYRYRSANVQSAAQSILVEEMNTPMLLFNHLGELLMVNRRARELFKIEVDDTEEEFLMRNGYLKINGMLDRQEFEATINADNSVFYFKITYNCLRDKHNRKIGTMYLYEDITESRKALILADFNADHDFLTGTYTRNYLYKFKEEARKAGNYPIYCAVYSVNNLSGINEEHGVDVGDKALSRLAWLLQQYSGALDLVIRASGNEILLILNNMNERKARDIFARIDRRIAGYEVDDVPVSARGSSFVVEDIDDFEREYKEAKERHERIKEGKGRMFRLL